MSTTTDTTEPTATEIAVAQDLAAMLEHEGIESWEDFHDVCDANMVLIEAMEAAGIPVTGADGGLDIDATAGSAERITDLITLFLADEIEWREGTDDATPTLAPMVCADCGRPTVYDDRVESYRHLLDPGTGCFLVGGHDPVPLPEIEEA